SPASVRAPRPAHVRTADGNAPALAAARRPPTPRTTSRTAKLRVMSVSLLVPSDRAPRRAGARAKARPIATLIPAKPPTTRLGLTPSTAPNVARGADAHSCHAPPRVGGVLAEIIGPDFLIVLVVVALLVGSSPLPKPAR